MQNNKKRKKISVTSTVGRVGGVENRGLRGEEGGGHVGKGGFGGREIEGAEGDLDAARPLWFETRKIAFAPWCNGMRVCVCV